MVYFSVSLKASLCELDSCAEKPFNCLHRTQQLEGRGGKEGNQGVPNSACANVNRISWQLIIASRATVIKVFLLNKVTKDAAPKEMQSQIT